MEIKTKAKKWGSSLGVILPKSFVETNRIRENDEVIVEVRKQVLVKDLFGVLKDWKRPTQEIKDEMRKGWD